MPPTEDISEVVRTVIADTAPRPGPLRVRSQLVNDLGFDSVTLIELMAALESRLGLAPVPGDKIAEVVTVGDVERLVRAVVEQRGAQQ